MQKSKGMKATSILLQTGLWIGCSALLAFSGAGAGAPKGAAVPSSAEIATRPGRSALSGAARAALHARMKGHGDDMAHLSMAVVGLRYEEASSRAHQIATEPKMARDFGGDLSSVNAELPSRFFTLQDELSKRASALEAAAKAQDDAALAPAYGRVAEACVACHSQYLPREARAQDPLPGAAVAP